jgi:hypothetical protein
VNCSTYDMERSAVMPFGAPVGALGAVRPPVATASFAAAAPTAVRPFASQVSTFPALANAANGMRVDWAKCDRHDGIQTTRPARHLRRTPT